MMRTVVFMAIGVFALLVGGCTDTNGRNVNDVLADPSVLNGPVKLVGIMAGMSQDPSVFGIMDTRELEPPAANRGKTILPVRYKGRPPVRGDEVLVSGTFVKDLGGYVFDASQVKVLKHHQLQLKR